jgi:hypothetical protein
VLGLLSGLGIEELVALGWDQTNFSAGIINVAGEDRRAVGNRCAVCSMRGASCRP